MTHSTFRTIVTAVLALAGAAIQAHAQDLSPVAAHTLGQHPAVLVQRQAQHIDPNQFIVQPPASVAWKRVHANGDHPAVIVARRAADAYIDANTFLVQPPVQVTWTLVPADASAMVLARSATPNATQP